MDPKDETASSRFACDDKERALFEAGIKMGTLYHQFVGTPVNMDSAEPLEKAMEAALETQPCTVSADIRIDRSAIPSGDGTFCYTSLTGEMIDAVIKVRVGTVTVTAEMRYDAELDYPLMYISEIVSSDRCK